MIDLASQPTPSIVGAVLAGGQSTRMGRDKATLPMPDGRTMIEHVVDALSQVCERVVIAGGASNDFSHGLPTIPDIRPRCGPLGGIEALLASGVADCYLVCACDAPHVTTKLLNTFATENERTAAAVLRVTGQERFECLPLRIGASSLPIVRKQLDRNEFAVWRTIQLLDPHIIDISEQDAACLRNANTPKEFADMTGRTRS